MIRTILLALGFLYLTEAIHQTDSDLYTEQSKILFARKKPNARGWSIYSINPDGSGQEVLIPSKSGMGEYNPSISSDGSKVLFNTYRYGGWKLATYDIESSDVKRVTMGSPYFTNGVFSHDGKKMVYEKNQRSGNHIFIADENGSNETNLTSVMGKAENRVPVLTPDGKTVVFFSNKDGSNDIFSIDLKTKSYKNLTRNRDGNDFAPAVSPDGKQIAFYSDRDGHLDLFVMNIDGSSQVNLTKAMHTEDNVYNYFKDNNTFWFFKVSWSPDGKRLVFGNVLDVNVDLFTMTREGKDLVRLTNTPQSEFTPTWGLLRK